MSAAVLPPEEDFEDLYEHAPCGYLSITPDGRIAKANATFSTWIGYSVDELLSKRLHDLLNVAGRIFYETHFAPLLRMQGFFNEVALDLMTKQGVRLPALVNAAERRDADGRHLFTRLTVFNATDRRQYERELLEARSAAEDAKKRLEHLNVALSASLLDAQATAALREQFIAVLGHDLRTPLSAVASGSALIMRMQPSEPIGRTAEMIQRSVVRMAGLIENVLDFARGRLGGGITLNRASEQLNPVLRQVIEELQIGQPERDIVTQIELREPIDCDRRRIAQLFSNLLANALTHGEPSEPIRVGASASDEAFELWVANSGEPIAPETMERLFQPYYRGEVRASQQGLGLGLFIAAEIARAHGGNISVNSTPAETRFLFRMAL